MHQYRSLSIYLILILLFYSSPSISGINPRLNQASNNRVYFDWVKSGETRLEVKNRDGQWLDIGPIIDKVNNPKTNLPIPVEVSAKIPKKQVTLAMLKPLARAVPVLGTALALKDFMDGIPDNYYSDYTLGDDAKLYKKNTGEDFCYRVRTGGGPSDCYPSGSTACKAVYGSAYPDIRYLQSTDTSGECRNFHIEIGYGVSITKLETIPPPRLATIEELASDIDAQPDWPQSMLDKSEDLINSGAHPEIIPTPENTTVTGPSSVPDIETTITNSDNSTTTTKITTNITYDTNSLTITNQTTTINKDKDGNPLPDTPPEDPPEEVNPPTDPDMPEVPDFYEQKYPDGFAGVWNTRMTAIKASPLFSLVDTLTPSSLGSGGGCPSFILPVSIGQWNWGTHDISPPCIVWDFGKLFLMLGALLLARALIFGG